MIHFSKTKKKNCIQADPVCQNKKLTYILPYHLYSIITKAYIYLNCDKTVYVKIGEPLKQHKDES